jgi:hypothetical protein
VLPSLTLLAPQWLACLDRMKTLAPQIGYRVAHGNLSLRMPNNFTSA